MADLKVLGDRLLAKLQRPKLLRLRRGVLERDLPDLRAQHPGSEVTLLGLRPDGHLWQTRYEGEAADEEAAARIWQDISDHIVLWARWANEPGTTPFAVTSGERRPQRTPPFVAVPLPVPLDKAKLQATELIDELRQRAYWLDGRQWDIPDILLADEGEIDFRSACVPVPAASDGRAELDELCRLLA